MLILFRVRVLAGDRSSSMLSNIDSNDASASYAKPGGWNGIAGLLTFVVFVDLLYICLSVCL